MVIINHCIMVVQCHDNWLAHLEGLPFHFRRPHRHIQRLHVADVDLHLVASNGNDTAGDEPVTRQVALGRFSDHLLLVFDGLNQRLLFLRRTRVSDGRRHHSQDQQASAHDHDFTDPTHSNTPLLCDQYAHQIKGASVRPSNSRRNESQSRHVREMTAPARLGNCPAF
jgi:hypothetical protein